MYELAEAAKNTSAIEYKDGKLEVTENVKNASMREVMSMRMEN